MIRSVSLLALAGTLWASAAQAQMSESDLLTRINHLEAEIRELTGTVEQLQYRNHQLEEEVQRLQAGAPAANSTPPKPTAQNSPPPYSPTPPAGGQYSPPAAGVAQYPPPPPPPPYSPPSPAAVAAAAPAAPADTGASTGTGGRHGDAFNPALNPTAPGAPRALGTSTSATEPPPPVADSGPSGARVPGAPLDLSAPSGGGDLPPPAPANTSATGANTGTMQASLPLPPNATPKDEYDLGYGYVMRKDYGPATDTFRDFLKKYPTDRMAADAQYWLGESLFQGQHYRDAAESFLAVSTKYDNPARAPDALMRLGQSLAALGEKEAACASLGEVLRKYPKASPAIKQNVDREQKRVHC